MIEKFLKKLLEKLHIISPPETRLVELLRKQCVEIGEKTYIYGAKVDGRFGKCIKIGNGVGISEGVQILAHDASTKYSKDRLKYSKVGRVIIGDNVFIGYGAIILPETFIGDNCLIAAGAVVRGRVEPDSVMVGNPAVRVCSYSEYISKNKKLLEDGFVCDGDFTDDVILMMNTKRVFIE